MKKHTKQKNTSSVPIPQAHPGCMWSIFQVLKYNHWHWRFIKKRLPHRKHVSGAENSRDNAESSNADDSSNYSKTEAANLKVEGKKKPSSPTSKGSVKSRLKKALIGDEMSKRVGRGKHHRSSTYPAQSPHLPRTDSVHQAEAQLDDLVIPEMVLNDEIPEVADRNHDISSTSSLEDQDLPKSSEEPDTSDENDEEETGVMLSGNDLSHKQVDETEKQLIENATFSQKRQDFLKRKSITSKDLMKDASGYRSKYLTDALDIINMNKGFLLTILQAPGSPLADHFHNQLAISGNMGITKSETFPSPSSSSRTGSGPRRPKQNQTGTEFHGRKSLDHESTEDICKRSMPLIAADHRADGIHELNQSKTEMADFCSYGSPLHAKQSRANKMAKMRFKHLKQNIKHAIKESKKERHRIAMDAILHKIPHKKGFSQDLTKDILDHFKDPFKIKDFFTASSIRKRKIHHERRTSSLDRYAQLYNYSFNRENSSKRIEETREEEKVLPRTTAPKSLSRIFSSPELYSYVYLSEDSDAFSSDMPATFADRSLSISSSTEQNILEVSEALDHCLQLDISGKNEFEENLIDISDQLASNSFKNLMVRDVSENEQESKLEILPTTKLEEPSSSFIDLSFEGQITSPTEILTSQEAEFEPNQNQFAIELGLLADMQQEFKDSSKKAENIVEFDKEEALKKDLDNDLLKDGTDRDDKHKFTYVKNVLEISGLSGNETPGTWHADDQPLDPLVYKEVKGCNFCDPQSSKEGEEEGYCNHPLLFDLINEVLIELYERSYSYCPRRLSSLCHIRPMPMGRHVLNEVWANISWYLSYEFGFDKPLDYVASRDLKRNDGWMNLQFENECSGLEIEELIFNDLLEELF